MIRKVITQESKDTRKPQPINVLHTYIYLRLLQNLEKHIMFTFSESENEISYILSLEKSWPVEI